MALSPRSGAASAIEQPGKYKPSNDWRWCGEPAIPGAARLDAELNTVAGQRLLRQRTDGITLAALLKRE